MRQVVIPICAAALTIATMVWQMRTVEPTLCDAPAVRLGEIAGLTSEEISPSEAELTTLPKDTIIDKRLYKASNGVWYSVSLVIGGRSKSSIHRPELCLPSQGFQMTRPRDAAAGGVDWRLVTLERGDAPASGFAYTFFNQDGFRTRSHVRRILRDVWDRSVRGRIDRWAMLTVHASLADDVRLAAFLGKLGEVIR